MFIYFLLISFGLFLHIGIFPFLDLFWQPSQFLCYTLLWPSSFQLSSYSCLSHAAFLSLGACPVLDVPCASFFGGTDWGDPCLMICDTCRSEDGSETVWSHSGFCLQKCSKRATLDTFRVYDSCWHSEMHPGEKRISRDVQMI